MKHSPLLQILLLSAMAGTVNAQSIEGFGSDRTEEIAEDAANEAKAEEQAEVITTPSRYVGLDLDAYIQTVASTLTSRTRTLDPFCRHQDPNYKPPAPKIARPQTVPGTKAPVTPFSDIVAAIPISTIIPAKQEFLIGGRNFTVGSQLQLNIGKSEPLTVQVMLVEAARVTFRNGATNEVADHRLNLLPGGMVRGVEPAKPDGIVPANGDAPIDIPTPGQTNDLSSTP